MRYALALLLSLFAVVAVAGDKPEVSQCVLDAKDARAASRADADEDYALAVAECPADKRAGKACREGARAERNAAFRAANAEYQAALVLCGVKQ